MSDEMEFAAFPKIPRLNRECIITEKLDGTNACVLISEDLQKIVAQSRTRIITADDDNYGFARWVAMNEDRLRHLLGPGRHFGEWWGAGIQRRYGMACKRFSLFNVTRWAELEPSEDLAVVPTLYRGMFTTDAVSTQVERLKMFGSVASPGFADPEGVVVYHVAANTGFKVTLKKDEEPKGRPAPPREGGAS